MRLIVPKSPNSNLPLFVYLPGMDGSGYLLRSQLPKLSRAFDVRCLQIPHDDLRDWQELTQGTIELIERERRKSQRPIYLFGESFGGCLALQVASKAPTAIDRLILSNPASSFNRRPLLAWGSHFVQWMPDFLNAVSALGLLPFLVALDRIPHHNRQALVDAMQSVSPQSAAWRIGMLRDFALKPTQLYHIQQPTLAIASALDRLLPSMTEVRELVDRLPNGRMHVLPHSGHACLLEEQVDLYDILEMSGFLPKRIRSNVRV
ncbi:MAG: alpha/beta fold hydrolase [Cyanobacteria bacterium SID2]|nr:alpha/beta fold hydrolase [Cyanobacteria bacterium SID2]